MLHNLFRHLVFGTAVLSCLPACLPTARAVEPETAAGSSSSSDSIRQGPRVLRGGPLGVGRQVLDFEFTTIEGETGKLSELARGKRAVVIAMTGIGCPLCKKYAPVLASLEDRYREQDVAFLYLNPNQSERTEPLREEVQEKGLEGPYVRDDEERITRLLGVETTTEVFVLDAARTLVYRGAVDDQYGLGYTLEQPRNEYLTAALDAVLAGRPPKTEATWAPGCEMFYQSDTPPLENPPVTYHNRISRILQRSCLECHREGGVGPMPLETYEQTVDYAGMIRSVVQREVMPPWFAAPQTTSPAAASSTEASSDSADQETTAHRAHTPWANDRSLSELEKQAIFTWVSAGAPEGDPADAPLPRTFPAGWLIGQPDAVFEFPKPIAVPATGVLPYKYVAIETELTEDKWVRAIEVVPGDRGVVHHALVFAIPPGQGSDSRAAGGGIDYWGIYVPGNSTRVYPSGIARKLPAGSRIVFQMHYTPNGRATEDRTKVGLIYADEPPRYEAKTASIVNAQFEIPPGAPNHRIEQSLTVPTDVMVLGYLPHHHLRGKACRYDLTTADGQQELLLDVPRYDFNWQLFYQYAEPKYVAAGSKLEFTGWYDNSPGNPANPDPTIPVRWGEQTNDEMHVGYIEYIVLGQDAASKAAAQRLEKGRGPSRRQSSGGLFERLDVNGDGFITEAEVRKRMPGRAKQALQTLKRRDKNGDGKLTKEELGG